MKKFLENARLAVWLFLELFIFGALILGACRMEGSNRIWALQVSMTLYWFRLDSKSKLANEIYKRKVAEDRAAFHRKEMYRRLYALEDDANNTI